MGCLNRSRVCSTTDLMFNAGFDFDCISNMHVWLMVHVYVFESVKLWTLDFNLCM